MRAVGLWSGFGKGLRAEGGPHYGADMRVELPHFTEGLNRLVGTYRWSAEDGTVRGYTSASLAAELRRLGYSYSESYVHQLRTGAKVNPAAVLLAGLCEAFGGLDVRYWYDMETRVQLLRELDREMETF